MISESLIMRLISFIIRLLTHTVMLYVSRGFEGG